MAARPVYLMDKVESLCATKTTQQACERQQRNKKVCLWGLAEPHGRPSRSTEGTCVSSAIYKVAQHVKKQKLDLLRPKCAEKTKEQCKRDKECLFGHVFTPEQAEREDFKRPSRRDRCVPQSLYEQHAASNKNGVPRLWPRAGGAAPEEGAGAMPGGAASGAPRPVAAPEEAAGAGAAGGAPRPMAAPAGPPLESTQPDADRFERSRDLLLTELKAAVETHESFSAFIAKVNEHGLTWWLYWGPFMAAFLSEEFRAFINKPEPKEDAEKTTQFLADAWKFYIARTRETPELGVYVERFLEVFFPDRLPQLHHVLRAYENAEGARPLRHREKSRGPAVPPAPAETEAKAAARGPAAAILERPRGLRREKPAPKGSAAVEAAASDDTDDLEVELAKIMDEDAEAAQSSPQHEEPAAWGGPAARSTAGRRLRQKTIDPHARAAAPEEMVETTAANGPAASIFGQGRSRLPKTAAGLTRVAAFSQRIIQALEAHHKGGARIEDFRQLVTDYALLSIAQQWLVLNELPQPMLTALLHLLQKSDPDTALAKNLRTLVRHKTPEQDPDPAPDSESERPPAPRREPTPLEQFLVEAAKAKNLNMKKFWKSLVTFKHTDYETDFKMMPINYAFLLGKLLSANSEEEVQEQTLATRQQLKNFKYKALYRILFGLHDIYYQNLLDAMTALKLKAERADLVKIRKRSDKFPVRLREKYLKELVGF